MDERLIQIKRYVTEGKAEDAHLLADKIKDDYWRSYALKWVAEGFVKKNPEKALEVAGEICIESIKNETLLFLSYKLAAMERFKEALEAAKSIKDAYLKKKAMRSVGNSIVRALIHKGIKEISLSELNLDENDVEYLQPLPKGIVYKDKKFLISAEIHSIKGEMKYGVLVSEPIPKEIEKPRFDYPKHVDKGENEEYVSSYVRRLIAEGKLKEAHKLAAGMEEPLKSSLLEEIGLAYLRQGLSGEAEKIFEEISFGGYLARALAKLYLEQGDLERAKHYTLSVVNVASKLSLIYELILAEKRVDIDFIRQAIPGVGYYKLGRILKFLAFELLKKGKLEENEEIRKLSKSLFLLGKDIQKGKV